jgi:hypothetical protein
MNSSTICPLVNATSLSEEYEHCTDEEFIELVKQSCLALHEAYLIIFALAFLYVSFEWQDCSTSVTHTRVQGATSGRSNRQFVGSVCGGAQQVHANTHQHIPRQSSAQWHSRAHLLSATNSAVGRYEHLVAGHERVQGPNVLTGTWTCIYCALRQRRTSISDDNETQYRIGKN